MRSSTAALATLLTAVFAASAGAQESERPSGSFGERLEVELVTVPVRVLDPDGHSITGLGAADFRLLVGGREVAIESVDWLEAGAPAPLPPGSPREPVPPSAEAPPVEPGALAAELAGRLVVVFVQTALEPSRGPGLIQMVPKLARRLERLAPEDWVAIVSYDSHLKLRQDFTRDRRRLEPALHDAVRLGTSPRPRFVSSPSLAVHLDPGEARRAAKPERALELVARALEPLGHPATLVFLGWGLGERATLGHRMPREYEAALASLERSRTSVFVLDVTDAAYHSLELGLQQVADDTGGGYQKTDEFPDLALERVDVTLGGQYLVAFRPPSDARGDRIRVELRVPELGRVISPSRTVR